MLNKKINPQTKGILFVLFAGVFWGISAVCAQFLFQQREIKPQWLVSVRLLFSGLILLIFAFSKYKSQVFNVFRKKETGWQVVAFGLCGMMGVQMMYFMAIKASNAATATVLQYLGPVLVAAFYAIKRRRWPNTRASIAIVLAISGTFLLVTHGELGRLTISQAALFWGLGGATALAFNSIFPIRLLQEFDSTVVLGWAMLFGGLAVTMFIHPPWEVVGIWDSYTYAALFFILIFGSLTAFYLYLNAIHLIGAEISSLMATVQPLSATLLAVLVLGVPFVWIDWIGALCIITTIVLLAKKK